MNTIKTFEELEYKKNVENGKITYSQDFGSGYFEIIFDLSENEIEIETNMEVVIENDLLLAINQQCKELGWIEEEKKEIKQETNLEHYKDEIKYVGYEFSLVSGKPTACKLTSCDKCYFDDKHFTCARKRMEWMLEPYKKSVYKLTKFEYDLLNAYKNSGMKQCISNYSTLLELYEKGHIKDIDISTPIHEILDNCEVIKDENC